MLFFENIVYIISFYLTVCTCNDNIQFKHKQLSKHSDHIAPKEITSLILEKSVGSNIKLTTPYLIKKFNKKDQKPVEKSKRNLKSDDLYPSYDESNIIKLCPIRNRKHLRWAERNGYSDTNNDIFYLDCPIRTAEVLKRRTDNSGCYMCPIRNRKTLKNSPKYFLYPISKNHLSRNDFEFAAMEKLCPIRNKKNIKLYLNDNLNVYPNKRFNTLRNYAFGGPKYKRMKPGIYIMCPKCPPNEPNLNDLYTEIPPARSKKNLENDYEYNSPIMAYVCPIRNRVRKTIDENDFGVAYICPIRNKNIVKRRSEILETKRLPSVLVCPIRNKHKVKHKTGDHDSFSDLKKCSYCPIHNKYKINVEEDDTDKRGNRNFKALQNYLVCPIRNKDHLRMLNNYNMVNTNICNSPVLSKRYSTISKREESMCQDWLKVLMMLVGAQQYVISSFDTNMSNNIQQDDSPLLSDTKTYVPRNNMNKSIKKLPGFNDNEKVFRGTKKEKSMSLKHKDKFKNKRKDFEERKRKKSVINEKTQKHHCVDFLKQINDRLLCLYEMNSLAQWNFETNITNDTREKLVDTGQKYADTVRDIWKEATTFKNVHGCDEINDEVERQLKILMYPGETILDSRKYVKLQETVHDMESIYSMATICSTPTDEECNCKLEPDIMDMMAHIKDPKKLEFIWVAWRNATGRKMLDLFDVYVKLMNEAARLNGFKDASCDWISSYEDPNFEKKVRRLWAQVRPLYLQLHAYVRKKLRERYGEKYVDRHKRIPAHLLGNLWAQTWTNIYNISAPYPEYVLPDVTKLLNEKGFTPKKMVCEAEKFFVSMNLSSMPDLFWNNSVIEVKNATQIVCHASAWDMFKENDFRIKMCSHVTAEDFITIHHEMGHIEYDMQYRNLPAVFREGANPGFHEAIGDVIALSVSTLNHLRRIKLIPDAGTGEGALNNKVKTYMKHKEDINFLYSMALQKVAFLPYAFVVFHWQYSIFRGVVSKRDYNNYWWKLRKKYQGLEAPVKRTCEDFDPGAKFHIAAGVPYLRYFVSYIIQFQFHEALCTLSGLEKTPLHHCDIYGKIVAGNTLKKMLEMGYSKPWPIAMEVLTGTKEMDSSALLRYFKPLELWLINENKKSMEKIGWDEE